MVIQQPTWNLELNEFEWCFLTALVDRFVTDYYAAPRGGVRLSEILKLERKLLDGFESGPPSSYHFLGY